MTRQALHSASSSQPSLTNYLTGRCLRVSVQSQFATSVIVGVGGSASGRGPTRTNPDQAGRKPKRGQREGSVYQRRDGVWVGRIMLGRKANGKPDRPKLTGPTRADVQRQLAELRLRAERGELVDSSQ